VDHGIDVAQVTGLHVPDVEPQCPLRQRRRPERAVGEEVAVEADHVVPGGTEHGHEHGADVAVVAGDEHAHGSAPPVGADEDDGPHLQTFHGGFVSHSSSRSLRSRTVSMHCQKS
jgi:hypothetical protein